MDGSYNPAKERVVFGKIIFDPDPKRRRKESDDLDSHGTECSDDNDKRTMQHAKRLRQSSWNCELTCPFRKRNPLRFNVRNYSTCALNTFPQMSLLKRHIRTVHILKPSTSACPRCKSKFEDQAALNHHLTAEDRCLMKLDGPQDPEDGITQEVTSRLTTRDGDQFIREWDDLWKLLFPMDGPLDIPEPDHEPPIELDQVEAEFFAQKNLEELQKEFHRNHNESNTSFYFCVNYITTILSRCRSKNGHFPSPKRRQVEEDYLLRAAACMRCDTVADNDLEPRPSASGSYGSEFDGSDVYGTSADRIEHGGSKEFESVDSSLRVEPEMDVPAAQGL